MYIIQMETADRAVEGLMSEGDGVNDIHLSKESQALKEFVGNLAGLRIDGTWSSNGAAAIRRSLEWLF